MPSLIERIRKVTVVAAFLFECLLLEPYPSCLVWENKEDFTCRLKCIHKKKKGYTPEVEQIFKGYILFKTRKSIAKGQGERSVLLQAIKASPYVEIVKNLSTPDEKFCRFTEKFRTLLNSLLQENTLELGDLVFENSLISTNGMDMPEILDQSVASEPASPVPDVDMAGSLEEDQSSFYPENGRSRRFSSQEGLLLNGNFNLSGYEQSALLPPFEQSASLPVIEQSAPLQVFEQTALLPTFEQPLPILEQPAPLPILEQPAPLPILEQPSCLPMREKSSALYPPDYDPVEDLLHSQRGTLVSPCNSMDNHVNSPNKAQTSAFEMHDVCGVKLEGNRVHMLTDVGPSSPLLHVPTYYTFFIRRPSQ